MTNLSPLTSRSFLPAAPPAQAEKNARPDQASLGAKARNDLVSLSKNGIDLQQRVEALGHSTVDLAENLVGSFAQQLFGDAAKGATIAFNSVSLETSAAFAAGVQHTEGAGRVSDAAAFSLTESSHFIGKGTITTADGRQFDFEVEVQYDYALEAATSRSVSAPPAPGKDGELPRSAADPLPEIQFPDIRFPGSLQDLFRLFDKPLTSDVVRQSEAGQEKLGTLSLRLLNLVDNKGPQDIYHPSDRAKAVANAYGAQDRANDGAGATDAVNAAAALPATPGALAAAQAEAALAAPAAPAGAADTAGTGASAVADVSTDGAATAQDAAAAATNSADSGASDKPA